MPSTYLAFGPNPALLSNDAQWLAGIRQELSNIALTIARFEPVTVLVREHEQVLARQYMGDKVGYAVCELDDYWLRDTGCVFKRSASGRVQAVDFNFNGWGNKQPYGHGRCVAHQLADMADVPRVPSSLVLEGGALELDSAGTALLARSCVLNPNRNPGKTAADVEAELHRLFGVTHTIWLPGITNDDDMTDGHISFYARFVRPGVVVAQVTASYWGQKAHDLSLQHVALLRQATHAQGQPLQVHVLQPPRMGQTRLNASGAEHGAWMRRKGYSASDAEYGPLLREGNHFTGAVDGYANYYVCSGAVLLPEFGDVERDNAAQALLAMLYPDKEVIALNIDGIAEAGGGIHRVTLEGL